MDKKLFIQTSKITKKFGDVTAVNEVNMDIYLGEIRGLIGENGSGKSTISSMISGIYTITSGEIYIGGTRYKPSSPADAHDMRISMIVQEAGTIDHLTVAENIFLGSEKGFSKMGFIDNEKMVNEAQKALDKIGVSDICAADNIDMYNFEQRKIIEIAKALYYDPQLFIVDETTTALSQDGRIKIYEIMNTLKNNGKAVLFISHDLPELMMVCDTLTVLRDGNLIATMKKEEFDEDRIKQTMVGREIKGNFYRNDFSTPCKEEVLLKIDDASTDRLKNINLNLHAGEILGIGGLSGSGIHELGRICFGMDALTKGLVTARATRKLTIGEKLRKNISKVKKKTFETPNETKIYEIKSVNDALESRIGYISKDRDRETLILESSVADNLTLSALDQLQVFGFISPIAERKFAEGQIGTLNIKCSSKKQLVKELSGGNKQKISFGKWIGNDSKILIFDSPTRGVDIGVKTTMYQLLYDLRQQGYAIMIISEELSELIGMSDRICIMKNGEITKTFEHKDNISDSKIIEFMI
ncbi:ATP-binding cassette domain-containing protein [Alkalibaculum sp. M08DMB]|uniref:ATP-binding cassette domain-containing protein n=1 Tax=Alkalibaculum sporogenes TaxID=2655001 RepID=A0A6A7KB49_9FIRM|nr:sugar ABC transporter ATP-binding protein [Alkalibaculum sporogenes]MPW26575.1 ATP-binding cassette domain-containing protein [Alkalibaculum sporogenes]